MGVKFASNKRYMRLLALTDFSDAARHAVEYACMVAHHQKGLVSLFHVYQLPVIDVEMPSEVYQAAIESARTEVQTALEELQAGLAKQYPEATIELDYAMGFTVEETARKARAMKPDYVVAGARGQSSVWETLLGGTVRDLIDRIEWPMWVVPAKAPLQMPARTAYASSLDNDTLFPLGDFARLSDRLSAAAAYVHIHHTEKSHPLHDRYVSTLQWALARWGVNAQYHEIPAADMKRVNEQFSAYIAETDIHLIGIRHQHKGIFDILFQKSFTYQLLHHISIPLIVYS